MKSSSVSSSYRNRVLASLPLPEIERLALYLVPVNLARHKTLHHPGETVETLYFLEEGVCSVVVALENGDTVEVGLIGYDGFVGAPAVMGTDHSPNRSFMQIPGHGFSVKADIVRELFGHCKKLRLLLQRCIQGSFAQTAQTAACNRIHELEERLARWLLMCHDRVQGDRVSITHEFLGMMLGTRRSSVTIAAGILAKAGIIEYSRGHVDIRNRVGLEHAACECYQTIHTEYLRLGLF